MTKLAQLYKRLEDGYYDLAWWLWERADRRVPAAVGAALALGFALGVAIG